MTIDPAKFDAQGKPTKQQARTVWDSLPNPSARNVAAKLEGMGYEISWRTIARWHASDWREIELSRSPATREIGAAVRAELKKLEAPKPSAGLEAAIAPPAPSVDELALIEARRQELMLMSEAQLDQTAAKARSVLNILMMESAARRAHVMVLIPKETAALVDSFTEATKVGLSGKDGQPPRSDDPKTIDGTVNREPPAPPNETADAIRKFKRAQEAA